MDGLRSLIVLLVNEHVILKNHNMIICHKTKAVANYRTQFRSVLSVVELLLAQNKQIYCKKKLFLEANNQLVGARGTNCPRAILKHNASIVSHNANAF